MKKSIKSKSKQAKRLSSSFYKSMDEWSDRLFKSMPPNAQDEIEKIIKEQYSKLK